MTIEKTDPAPSPAPAGASGGQRVRHKKRGTIYRVIGVGELQSDTELSEGARIVAYRCETDGRLWLRPQSEFEDGRFEPALAMTDAAWAKRAADLEEGHEVSAGIAPAPSPAPAGASDVSELVERLKRSAKEALSADELNFNRLVTRCDLWAGDMSSAATALSQQAAEIERLRERLGPHGLVVVTIGEVGHYVNEAVAAEIERLKAGQVKLIASVASTAAELVTVECQRDEAKARAEAAERDIKAIEEEHAFCRKRLLIVADEKIAAEANLAQAVECLRRLANAADDVGVKNFDTDSFSDEVQEMDDATRAAREFIKKMEGE